MKLSRRRTLILGVVTVGLIVLFPIFSGSAIRFYMDWLWFDDLGQLSTFRIGWAAQVVVWAASGLVVLAGLAINWFFVPRWLFGLFRLRGAGADGGSALVVKRLPPIALSATIVAVASIMAWVAADQWAGALEWVHGRPFGFSDPIFGFDVSFYVFRLPFYRFLVGWALGLIGVTLVGSVVLYTLAGCLRHVRAIRHLSVLGALFLVGVALGYQLQRWALVQSVSGAVFGAGYTDVHARMPLLTLLTGVVVVGAFVLLINAWFPRWRLLLGVGVVWLLLALLAQVYPANVQRMTVEPNELALERPFIEHNIGFTRYAYGLDEVREFDYFDTGELTAQGLEENRDTLDNVRLWDWRPLHATYDQMQAMRAYYAFADIDIDRYVLDGRLRQVTLAVRELDITEMREESRTWINRHLIYTHGYGLCMSPVGEVSADGLPEFLVRNIPPQSDHPELEITRPEIYFGEKTIDYVIVDTTEDEFSFPMGDQNVYSRYEGSAGVEVGGLLRRAALAMRFGDSQILFSDAVQPDSRVLFRRELTDRVKTLAPMLSFDADPYPVIVDGRIVWLYDAYTWTDRFPYSQPVGGLNYIRNSVKVVIDAYTGDTTFYVVDSDDPLIQTYQAIYPDLFTPVEEMDPVLREHWRYPEQLFLIQADIYADYHVEDPRVFYNKEDLWETPTEIRGSKKAQMAPYYVTIRLPDSDELSFILMRPYVPAGRQNMVAWLYAHSDGESYGELGVYKFSKEVLVYGPMQVESRIDQDPRISQQLSLWSQSGSSVNRGNLIVIPIDGTLLYVEPIYLEAEASRLPQFGQAVVLHRNRVAMADTLSAALAEVVQEPPGTERPGEPPEIGLDPQEPLAGEVHELALSAQNHYETAKRCLEEGDWACYGDALEGLERDLEALIAATGE